MSENSKIQWTDSTWNWSIGCTKISPGCAHCYAEVSTPVRVHRSQGKELWGGTVRQRSSEATFNAPLKWNEKPWVCDTCGTAISTGTPGVIYLCPGCKKSNLSTGTTWHRRRVFSLSLGDWLDEAIPIETLADALDVIRRCPNLDFLLLTKRPENWRDRIERALIYSQGGDHNDRDWLTRHGEEFPTTDLAIWLNDWTGEDAPANVWIGVTCENQEYADKRIPELLKIPAVCRFVSYEPALGPIRIKDALRCDVPIHWIICGGESGPKARPFEIEWARSTVAQCREAGVACFVKQLGAYPEDRNDAGFEGDKPGAWPMGTDYFENAQDPSVYQGKPVRIHLRDKKGGDILEWPEDLRVREFQTLNRMPV